MYLSCTVPARETYTAVYLSTSLFNFDNSFEHRHATFRQNSTTTLTGSDRLWATGQQYHAPRPMESHRQTFRAKPISIQHSSGTSSTFLSGRFITRAIHPSYLFIGGAGTVHRNARSQLSRRYTVHHVPGPLREVLGRPIDASPRGNDVPVPLTRGCSPSIDVAASRT